MTLAANGALRRWKLWATGAGALAALLSIGTVYLWPVATALYDQGQTMVWANELRHERPTLAADHRALMERLNAGPKRDAEVQELRTTVVAFASRLDDIDAHLDRIDMEQARQGGMLEALMHDRGLTPPRRAPGER